jgi:hypothetical protein
VVVYSNKRYHSLYTTTALDLESFIHPRYICSISVIGD